LSPPETKGKRGPRSCQPVKGERAGVIVYVESGVRSGIRASKKQFSHHFVAGHGKGTLPKSREPPCAGDDKPPGQQGPRVMRSVWSNRRYLPPAGSVSMSPPGGDLSSLPAAGTAGSGHRRFQGRTGASTRRGNSPPVAFHRRATM